jgi:hypothetical protein
MLYRLAMLHLYRIAVEDSLDRGGVGFGRKC